MLGGVGGLVLVRVYVNKLDILHVAIPPIFAFVGCTLGCCTEIPTRAMTDDIISCLLVIKWKLS